ncbi:gephyrin-like molybdotransferase Glp [Methylomarinum sp. Ch1-1]|uniref:Molybdopterin molybdenumtransferase n=1 Tax=Methylomarinum roseum TaxID=3067653 RepID=A0AAU7NPX4_9GAMM|nr:gephyrin-like molybdotransferase Glp [Methylomarinum sp. Ch1-1]MDP4521064.1 molybdopterin molybdotransferase MoeA [Methylomarinum sp. Ch1-1]
MTTAKQPSCSDHFESGLLAVDSALANILSKLSPVDGFQQIAIADARGRTLDETIYAPFNVPGHDNSAVDGYAINSSDIPNQGHKSLPIGGQAFAGKPFSGRLPKGQCIRIMTGAPIPAGVDSVIMQEHVVVEQNGILIDSEHRAGQNIRRAGEDIPQGAAMLSAGKLLAPADIGLLASIGMAEIKVKRPLRIAIASTGDELHALGEHRAEGGVYDSNRYSLQAALDRKDIEILDLGILADKPDTLLSQFSEASRYADMIISSGGVSVGDADFTKTALQEAGQIDFWKIALKPGRPLAFGTLNDSVFFGLPGNPVAVMVTFYQFVLPAIEKMLGIVDKPIAPTVTAVSTETIRKKPGRTEVVRGILEPQANGQWTIKTTGKQGSGLLRSMSLANAFIILEHDRTTVGIGETVKVQPFAGLI